MRLWRVGWGGLEALTVLEAHGAPVTALRAFHAPAARAPTAPGPTATTPGPTTAPGCPSPGPRSPHALPSVTLPGAALTAGGAKAEERRSCSTATRETRLRFSGDSGVLCAGEAKRG